jgi:hypothetical protein
MLTRRQFHRRLAAAAGALAATTTPASALRRASGQTPEKQASGKKSPLGQFVDMHTHLGQTWNTKETLKAEDLLRWMDAREIGQAVVLPLVSPESSSYPLTTDFVLGETKPHRDRREFLVRRADRLMFGADFLSPGQAVPQFELFEKLDLPDDVRAKISRDNARKLLG